MHIKYFTRSYVQDMQKKTAYKASRILVIKGHIQKGLKTTSTPAAQAHTSLRWQPSDSSSKLCPFYCIYTDISNNTAASESDKQGAVQDIPDITTPRTKQAVNRHINRRTEGVASWLTFLVVKATFLFFHGDELIHIQALLLPPPLLAN